jgi:hypothetical protein
MGKDVVAYTSSNEGGCGSAGGDSKMHWRLKKAQTAAAFATAARAPGKIVSGARPELNLLKDAIISLQLRFDLTSRLVD